MPDLFLDESTAIARGKARLVFQHPLYADRVIKVMRPGYAGRVARRRRPFSLTRRYGVNRVLIKEVSYFLEIRARAPELQRLFAEIHGFADTNLGLGLDCEKIADRDGSLAPTLAELHAEGRLTPEIMALTDALLSDLARQHFVVHDLNPRNVAVAGGPAAPERLVVVDGFGDPYLPPLRRLSARINRFCQARADRRFRLLLGPDP